MRIKIIKQDKSNNCYECDRAASSGVTNWEEVSTEDYSKLREAVTYANMNRKDMWYYYILVEEENIRDVFSSAKEFHDEQMRLKRQRERENKERKDKRAAASKERKLKQLARLKKELERE